MKRTCPIILGIYDSVLALGATYCGLLMVYSNSGIFSEYPTRWLSKLPFTSWSLLGILVISVFGVGNLLASIFSFKNKSTNSWFASALMGMIFLISIIFQVLIIGEWYLATAEFLVLSLIQLCLSGISLLGKDARHA